MNRTFSRAGSYPSIQAIGLGNEGTELVPTPSQLLLTGAWQQENPDRATRPESAS
jgi:hypothetical protein